MSNGKRNVHISMHIRVTEKEGYSTTELVDRQVSLVVPPGAHPLDVLKQMLDEEFGATKRDALPHIEPAAERLIGEDN